MKSIVIPLLLLGIITWILLAWAMVTTTAWNRITRDVDDPREVLSWKGEILMFPHYVAWRFNEWLKAESIKEE